MAGWRVGAVFGLFVVGCGSNVVVGGADDAPSGAGGGGESATSVTSTGGSPPEGGGGEAPAVPCHPLLTGEPIVAHPADTNFYPTSAVATLADSAGERVVFLSEWAQYPTSKPKVPGGPYTRYVSSKAWETWPPTFSLVDAFEPLRRGAKAAPAFDSFSVVGVRIKTANPGLFYRASHSYEDEPFLLLSAPNAPMPLALARAGTRALVLTEGPLLFLVDDAAGLLATIPLGCGSSPVRGHAIPSNDGFLVVTSRAAGCSASEPTLASTRLDVDGGVTHGGAIAATDVQHVELVQTNEQTWLLFSVDHETHDLWAARVRDDLSIDAPMLLLKDFDGSADFAVAPADEGLVLSYATTAHGLVAQRWSPPNPLPSAFLDIPDPAPLRARPSLTAHAGGREWVVGWVAGDVVAAEVPETPPATYVARFGCEP